MIPASSSELGGNERGDPLPSLGRLAARDDARPRAWARGVELIGGRGPGRRPVQNPALDALASLGAPGPLRILAAHGGVAALTPDRRDASLLPLAPIEQAIAQERIHYAAL